MLSSTLDNSRPVAGELQALAFFVFPQGICWMLLHPARFLVPVKLTLTCPHDKLMETETVGSVVLNVKVLALVACTVEETALFLHPSFSL